MKGKIPQGYHTVTPSLVFKDATAAIALYKKAFGATENSCLRSPDGKVMHACITSGNSKIFLFDENPQMCAMAPGSEGASVSFYLYVDDPDASAKQALGAGMKEIMPVQDMFWGDRMGAVQDPFGYKWNLAAQVREMSMDEVKQAAQKAMGKAA
jgi:PhnB protein